jgi:hypothetical protein
MRSRRHAIHPPRWVAVVALVVGFASAAFGAPAGAQTGQLLEPEEPTREAAVAQNVGPGDVVELALVARNVSGDALAVQAMVTGLTGPDAFLEGTNGLHASVHGCTVRWAEVTTDTGAPSYTCPGAISTLANRASVSSLAEQPLAIPGMVDDGELVSLRITVEFPASAGNPSENLASSTVRFDLTATGPGGEDAGNAIESPFDDLFDYLAYTGAPLLITALVGLSLLGGGLAVRRAARKRHEVPPPDELVPTATSGELVP